jgi:ribosomal silencing factor RsfS
MYGCNLLGMYSVRSFSTKPDDGDAVKTTTHAATPVTDIKAIDDEWIPPNRPLAGDKGRSNLYAHIEEAEEMRRLTKAMQLLEESTPTATVDLDGDSHDNNNLNLVEPELLKPLTSIDWLKTRRTMLTGQKMMKPDEASLLKKALVDVEIPAIEHTLLTQQELIQCIEAVGGRNVEVVLDKVTKIGGRRRMGDDVLGIILVTGTNYIQMQNIANHIVRQLRRRKLQEVNVIGAESGPDGNMNDPNENWYVVDCYNYIVHIQDAKTRAAVNLAALWSGQDPLRTVDITNEDAIEAYVAKYPVPETYTAGSSISSSSLYDANNWDATIKQFERNRWTKKDSPDSSTRNKPIVPKRKRKTSGRKT